MVAEKTGYPTEMLELDMELEADLGIDSIKRVEILSAMQEKHPEYAKQKIFYVSFYNLHEIETIRALRSVGGRERRVIGSSLGPGSSRGSWPGPGARTSDDCHRPGAPGRRG